MCLAALLAAEWKHGFLDTYNRINKSTVEFDIVVSLDYSLISIQVMSVRFGFVIH